MTSTRGCGPGSSRYTTAPRTAHGGLDGLTPLARYQRDLVRIRSLGAKAAGLDALFHRSR